MVPKGSASPSENIPSLDPAGGHAREIEAQVIARAVQDPAYRARLLADPKAVFADLGLSVPPEVRIQALQETAEQYYLVLPAVADRPPWAGLSDAQLEAIAGGWEASTISITDSCNTGWTGCGSGQSGCLVQ